MSRSNWKLPYVDTKLKTVLIGGADIINDYELKSLSAGKETANLYQSFKERFGSEEINGNETEAAELNQSASVDIEVNEISSKDKSSKSSGDKKVTKTLREKKKGAMLRKAAKAAASGIVKKKKGSGRKKKGKSKEIKRNEKEFKLRQRSQGLKAKTYGIGEFNTASRSSTIIPQFLGKGVAIHDGKSFISINVTENMIGHKIGEFVPTRRCKHNLSKTKKKISIRSKNAGISTGTKTLLPLFQK